MTTKKPSGQEVIGFPDIVWDGTKTETRICRIMLFYSLALPQRKILPLPTNMLAITCTCTELLQEGLGPLEDA